MNREFTIVVSSEIHASYADIICKTIEIAAAQRGTGIAKRQPEYILQKMIAGKAVIADKLLLSILALGTVPEVKFVALRLVKSIVPNSKAVAPELTFKT